MLPTVQKGNFLRGLRPLGSLFRRRSPLVHLLPVAENAQTGSTNLTTTCFSCGVMEEIHLNSDNKIQPKASSAETDTKTQWRASAHCPGSADVLQFQDRQARQNFLLTSRGRSLSASRETGHSVTGDNCETIAKHRAFPKDGEKWLENFALRSDQFTLETLPLLLQS